MPRTAALASDSWREFAVQQAGVVSLRQLISLGLTIDQARQWVRSKRWHRILPGVFATFTGPLPHVSRVWAAILYAGPAAAASHGTALWLHGLIDSPPSTIAILVPEHRRVRAPPGVMIRRTTRFDELVHPAATPPRVRLDEALLDHAARLTVEPMLTLVLRATQRRFTTAARLRAALARRRGHRWRRLLNEVLADVEAGVASALELRWVRDVERAHGLPRGERNRPELVDTTDGRESRTRYIDIRLPRWRLVIELDGRGAHPDESAFRDMRRDNTLTVDEGVAVLRYGWHDTAAHPCSAAAQVIKVLRARGWTGRPHPCRAGCPVS